ncbi:MAG: hypothetical protein MZV64_60720 [Ignavibacteriales bacterium]|nr:hypothetical protein [Ignavibacteriales bacterium]
MKKRAIAMSVFSMLDYWPLCLRLLSPAEKTRAHNLMNLVGAWKGKVQFRTGMFAEVKDFEFMWVFNNGGTMTESSNYDAVPPTPPCVWNMEEDRR